MQDQNLIRYNTGRHSHWVRLRTLTVLRWIAVLGQVGALLVAYWVYGVRAPLGPVAVVIGISVIANFVSMSVFPQNKRLPETAAFGMLAFDIMQLSALLALTGGLNNPFALLVLAPVTLSATALRPITTVILGALTIGLVTLVGAFYRPLVDMANEPILLPLIFLQGAWVAIVIGVVFLGVFAWRVTSEIHAMSEGFLATQMALAREQKLTDLGGVVAAAAHELGTPLATIKLTSAELADDLRDSPALAEDARLIHSQAMRCHEILRSMGRAGKDDSLVRTAPIEAVVREAAEPHLNRGIGIDFICAPIGEHDEAQPEIFRRPEIIHGLRNLIQNAVDFSTHAVAVEVEWSQDVIRIHISDDGPGFPAQVLTRIGDPFVHARATGLGGAFSRLSGLGAQMLAPFKRAAGQAGSEQSKTRPGYEGMGLGLFIAKTLLERSGARLAFANHFDSPRDTKPSGAVVQLEWSRSEIDAGRGGRANNLKENQPIGQ